MEINGRVMQVLPEVTGEGKNGMWKKQDFVIETDGQYPKKVCFTVWGDKINSQMMQEGNMLNVSFDVESREYNGRWYTDLKAWKIDSVEDNGGGGSDYPSNNAAPQSRPQSTQSAPAKLSEDLKSSGDDDLPF